MPWNQRNLTKKYSKLVKTFQASQRKIKQRFNFSIQKFRESTNYSKISFQINKYFPNSRKRCIQILRNLTKKTSEFRYKDLVTCRIRIEVFQKSSLRLCNLSLEMHSKFLETSFRISDLVRQLVKQILTAILFSSN